MESSKIKIKFKVSILFCVLFSFCLVMPSLAEAATLYLEPAEGNYSHGETFIEEIKLDTEGEDIMQ